VPTVAEVFSQAWKFHQAGSFSQAEELYREVLRAEPRHADSWCFLGAACQAQGKVADAELYYRQAAELLPDHPSASNCLGILLAQSGKLEEAARVFQEIVSRRPTDVGAWNNLGLVRSHQGRWEEATTHFRKALAIQPDYGVARDNLNRAIQNGCETKAAKNAAAEASAHNQRGFELFQQGRYDEAAPEFARAIEINPDDGSAHNNMGNIEFCKGRFDEAAAYYRQALRLKPNFAEAHNNLGSTLDNQGHVPLAMTHWREAIRLRSNFPEAHNNLGNALLLSGHCEDAATHCRLALRSRPEYPEALNNLGIALQRLGSLDEAVDCFEKALRINPQFAEAHSNLGIARERQGNLEEAIQCYHRALQLKPGFAEAHNNIGCIHLMEGPVDLALASFRRALQLNPDLASAQGNLVSCCNYDPNAEPDAVFAEHSRWGRTIEVQHRAERDNYVRHHASRDRGDPKRRLRIGYVSPDLRHHALSRYLEPVLANHDPDQVEVFCYAEVAFPDSVTHRLQNLAHHWCWTGRLTDAQVAARICADRIDILVDLAGHTKDNRLAVFARKPAPVQATWLGYLNTTGLTAMDYRLTDEILDPTGEPNRDTEELVRLAHGMCCFAPPADAPRVSPLPSLRSGHLTFGSLQSLVKLNGRLFDLWSQVLKSLPTSRLLLFRDSLTGAAQEHIRRQFTDRGIGPEQLDLRQGTNLPGYLRVYDEIDLGLDTFPCTGGVSTCESLWMGVPVITLCGIRPASRNSAALLIRAGLADWVAQTPEDYVALAVRTAGNLDQLSHLRAQLRDRVKTPLCNAQQFTQVLEEAYRDMWRRRTAQQ
jgi:protein O-GlcNAc transferase